MLGTVPSYGMFAGRNNSLIMVGSGKSARLQQVREAYRRVRASLTFLQSAEDAKSFLVTSARPGEGKSSTVANIGVAAAQGGGRVVIVSADMRRPTQEKLLGVSADRGLSDYLIDPTISDIMVLIPGVPGLALVPSGALPPNPGELLASSHFHNLIKELGTQFDLVLIDTPPVLSTADAASCSRVVDGVLIVVDGQSTDTGELLRVRTSLERAGANIIGAVLNKDRTDDGLSLKKDRYSYEQVASQR